MEELEGLVVLNEEHSAHYISAAKRQSKHPQSISSFVLITVGERGIFSIFRVEITVIYLQKSFVR